ncbi:hypothetical protein ACOMHN_063724 [Nucella lapillus]
MGVFSTIGAVFAGSSGTMFMFIVLAVSDHLWGENVFRCPCGQYRILYTLAFLLVPPVVIIFIDTSWRVLFSTCQMCCDEWDGSSKRSCKFCCCSCNRKTCETLVRLLIRPIIIALLWIIFSLMEPKFGRCIYKEVECQCTQKDKAEHDCTEDMMRKAAFLRVVMACVCLALTCLAFGIGLIYIVSKLCLRCYRRKSACYMMCRRKKYQAIEDEEESLKARELCMCLYTFGVDTNTVICLQREKLFCERTLMTMSILSLQDMRRCFGLGQMEILLEHRKSLRLARWMLDQNFTSDSIRTIVEKEKMLESSVLETIRKSLETTDQVSEELRQQLDDNLRKKAMGHLLPDLASQGDCDVFYLTRDVGVRG